MTDSKLDSGMLTAEQVRECVQVVYFEGYSDGSVNRGQHLEETDWQAIADELNTMLEGIEEPDTIRNELADGGLIADILAPVCVDEKERRAFERGRVHERFAQQIFKEATS